MCTFFSSHVTSADHLIVCNLSRQHVEYRTCATHAGTVAASSLPSITEDPSVVLVLDTLSANFSYYKRDFL